MNDELMNITYNTILLFLLLYYTPAAVQCIVIGPVCLWMGVGVFVCGWVYYYNNSKFHASILTKLGL